MFESILTDLDHQDEGVATEHVDNVHLQLDADGTCYHVANTSMDTEKNFQGLLGYIRSLRSVAGAEVVNVHTTLGIKGGRENMAYYVPYQLKRHGNDMLPEYKDRVNALREKLYDHQERNLLPYPQYFVEADDSMTQFHLAHIEKQQNPKASVIGTDDKDLNMVPGGILHLKTKKLDWNGTWCGRDGWVDNLGWVKRAVPIGARNKKLLGRGHKFFWAQMLAGDSTDNIKGVPSIPGHLADVYKPLKGNKQRADTINLSVGDTFAADTISRCQTDYECFKVVMDCYNGHFAEWGSFFLFENAFLLWMRRTPDPLDCLVYLRSLGFNYELHQQQKEALTAFYDAVRIKQQELQRAAYRG